MAGCLGVHGWLTAGLLRDRMLSHLGEGKGMIGGYCREPPTMSRISEVIFC